MQLISFGLGEKFDESLFQPVRNRDNKPMGGLWASPVNSAYAWRECSIGDLSTSFEFTLEGHVLVIDSLADFAALPKLEGAGVNFEQIAIDYVAIHLTSKGQIATRFVLPGYDCECVLVLNSSAITSHTRRIKC